MARRWHRAVLTASALLPLAAASAFAGPNGASVAGGAATVQGQGTANVIVNQSSQNAIINWQTFNIGTNETTKIFMPNSSSTQLDRVTGGQGPSQILGTLTSNGKVFLVNPDGILFGMGATINVGSLLATTHDIANSDFMAGRYNFSIPGNPNASIVNLGTITAQTGGFAALVAPGVRNTGTIIAKLGTIALASGNAFTLDMYGDNLITLGLTDKVASQVIDVATGKPLKSLVGNEGKLKANGGTVVLTAVGARKIVDSVINNSGVIEANTIGSHNGKIVLGGPTGTSKYARARKQTVTVSGTLSARGKRNGTTGGTIQITGKNIAVAGALIDASGQAGGGTVLIGGDWGGGHPNTSLASGNASAVLQPYAVPNANTVSIDAATMIDASATNTGNGGKVIVWANQATTFLGTILAKGGAQSGNGGYVETSGETLTFNGAVNTSAANGKTGTWLLDPTDLTIDAAAASTIDTNLATTNVTLVTNADGTTSGPGNTSSGPGDIIVAAPVSWSKGNTLTLDAYHDIKINNAITNSGAGNLVLRADSTGKGAGTVLISGESGKVDFRRSTGTVSIFYNPTDNSAGSGVNATSYTSPKNYTYYVLTSESVPDQLTAYMLVNTVYDLQNVQNNLSGTYALGANIDASATANWNNGAGFVPIGDSQNEFLGSLNGQGFAINNLTINSSAAYVGLFGMIGSGGSVQNLGIGNISLTARGWNGGESEDWAHVGALAGSNGGTISNSYATGTIASSSPYSIAPDTGGLVGTNDGSIGQSYASVNITESSTGGGLFVGGLVGWNVSGTVTQSYATGTVTNTSAQGAAIGGLVGNNTSTVTQSYSTGAVGGPGIVGGLIGNNTSTVTQSYSTGAVAGPDIVGGLIGNNDGSVTQSYSIGAVTGAIPSTTGGLIGVNDESGSVVSSYWDINTSLANGYGTNNNGTFGGQGLTTTQFQAGLPSGFNATAWASNISFNGGFPYLLWSAPAGSQVIAGYVFNDAGMTSAGGGISVSGLVNGASVGPVTTGANGSYNIVLLPGTISASGSQVLAYTTGANAGAAYMQNATGSVEHLNIYVGYLNETSGAANLSSVSAGLTTAIGSNNTAVQALVNGLSNRTINATGASFAIDQSLSAGTLLVSSGGAITQSAPLTVTNLALLGGGSFTLTNPGNQAGTLAANAGSVDLADATNLSIGTVAGTSGVTATTFSLTDSGAVTQSAPLTVTNLALLDGGSFTLTDSSNNVGTLAANAGGVSLTDQADLSIGSVAGTNGATATALTITDNGAVTQSAPLTVTNLALLGGGSFTLTNSGNNIGMLAANAGSVSLADSAGLSVGMVGGTSGVTATTFSLTDSGAVTQSAPLAVTNLALLGGSGSFTLTNLNNQVGTLAAYAGSVSLADHTSLNIGTVGATSGITASGALTLNVNGNIAATEAVSVGTFTLANGNWTQDSPLLPGFSAQNFAISGGSFLRASGGDGSSGNPYQIADVYGLQGIGSSATLLANSYVLGNAIDASGTANWNGGAGFVPIGGNNSFSGTLNGNGNTISGLTIHASSLSEVGLFGAVFGGVVENVGLIGGSVSGGVTTGELIGLNAGTVTNSYATGIVNGSASAESIGGLVGTNEGTITGSHATGAVNAGDFAFAGGLAGSNFGTIDQSHATGNVTTGANGISGGLVGLNVDTVSNGNVIVASISGSYATGNVSAGNGSPISTTSTAGGLVGDNFGTVTQSYAIGAVTVGVNGTAGGLVGQNGLGVAGSEIGTASISSSYATGMVSSSGINVQLGGLVGANDPGAVITNSQATGPVTSTVSLPPSSNSTDCSLSGTCLYVNVGGFVGANFGSISGTTWTTPPASCVAGGAFACAGGNVTVGPLGQGGGFAGYNEGIIQYAFATGNVTGAAGLPDTVAGNVFNNSTQIAGFVADNRGQIAHSFATGAVGTAGTMWLSAGGFAGDNKGTIDSSFATGAVMAGDNSTAGGFTGGNGRGTNTQTCPFCFVGDGFNNSAAISNSQAFGTVTVGALSIAGGFAASGGGNNNGQSGGSFTNVTASGAVNAGHDSIVGGLVGALLEGGTLANSAAQNTLVASSGANSIVGGIVGLNFGTISDTTSTAPVSGTSDSYIGGITGINLGQVTGSSTDPDITGSGGSNFIGGIAGLNAGSINDSTANIALSTGPSSYAGGVAGVNGSYSNTSTTIPNSSFPNGTITNSSATGTGFGSQTGTSAPTQVPKVPSWLNGCNDAVCEIFAGGSLQPGGGGPPTPPPTPPSEPPGAPNSPPPTVPPTDTLANQQVMQFAQPVNFTTTNIAPPLVDPATLASLNGGTPGNAGNGAGGNTGSLGNGNTGSLASGREGGNGAPPGVRLIDMPVMPLPPGSGVPPLGETRFLINEVVLQFGPEVTPQQVAAVAQRFNLTIVAQQTIAALHRTVYTFRINNGRSVAEVIRQIESAGLHVAAQPNYTYQFTQDQGDSSADLGDPAQYIVPKLQLGAVHRITQGNDIVVALIDSRVDTKQPDFAGRIVDSYDAGCGPNAPPDAHGTGMAGAIASHVGLLGVAPSARIIAICAFGGTGSPEATSSKIIRGVDYAIAHGAKIINMSFAGPRDPALAQELQIAREKGILIVAAAGNAGPKSPPLYPGADPNVMAVTATDEHDRLFTGANQGGYVTVAAPGVNILVPAPNGDVQFTTGTSVASANVSGVAALLMADKPTRTPEEIRSILVSTAKHLGAKGVNPQFGAGLVDPLKALRFVPAAVGRSSAASPIKPH